MNKWHKWSCPSDRVDHEGLSNLSHQWPTTASNHDHLTLNFPKEPPAKGAQLLDDGFEQKTKKTHTFSQKTGLWECLCHWLSWWHVSSTPDVTADFLSLSLSLFLTLVLPNSRECAGGRCISGRGGAFTMSTVREVWRTPLPLPRVSLSVSLWNLWRYFFFKFIWKAMRSKSKSLAGHAALASTTRHFVLHTPPKHILVIVRSLALFEISSSPFLLKKKQKKNTKHCLCETKQRTYTSIPFPQQVCAQGYSSPDVSSERISLICFSVIPKKKHTLSLH